MKVQQVFVFSLMVSVCGLAQAEPSARTGKQVVEAVCAECHSSGKMGAPKIGDQQAWLARIAQAKDVASLTSNAIRGIRNMPAPGGQGAVTDLEMSRAVTYMLSPNTSAPEVASAYSSPVAMTDKAIVEARCSQCHAEGKGGAPRIGQMEDWTPRAAKGLDAMVSNAIRGHNNMPARGGMASLSDAEMRSAALYMFKGTKF